MRAATVSDCLRNEPQAFAHDDVDNRLASIHSLGIEQHLFLGRFRLPTGEEPVWMSLAVRAGSLRASLLGRRQIGLHRLIERLQL